MTTFIVIYCPVSSYQLEIASAFHTAANLIINSMCAVAVIISNIYFQIIEHAADTTASNIIHLYKSRIS